MKSVIATIFLLQACNNVWATTTTEAPATTGEEGNVSPTPGYYTYATTEYNFPTYTGPPPEVSFPPYPSYPSYSAMCRCPCGQQMTKPWNPRPWQNPSQWNSVDESNSDMRYQSPPFRPHPQYWGPVAHPPVHVYQPYPAHYPVEYSTPQPEEYPTYNNSTGSEEEE